MALRILRIIWRISLDSAYERLRLAFSTGVIRRANAPEEDNRKFYVAAPRPRLPVEVLPRGYVLIYPHSTQNGSINGSSRKECEGKLQCFTKL